MQLGEGIIHYLMPKSELFQISSPFLIPRQLGKNSKKLEVSLLARKGGGRVWREGQRE